MIPAPAGLTEHSAWHTANHGTFAAFVSVTAKAQVAPHAHGPALPWAAPREMLGH